jgi:hypothetical protein
MTMTPASDADLLGDDLLVMDVADTLSRGIDLPIDLDTPDGNGAIIERLQVIYAQYGIDAPIPLLREGLSAARDSRFVHAPRADLAGWLARFYVARHRWVPPAFVVVLVLALGLGVYVFGYSPYRTSQAEQARLELKENLPGAMDALYQEIFNETKVQTAATDADEMRNRGKAAAQAGNRVEAQRAVDELTALRHALALDYTVRVVDQEGVKPGFWTFPPNNSEATNYYIVVEAVDASGKVLALPVTSDDTGVTQIVNRWGLRVPESIYDGIMADKQDDGTIESGLVGFKHEGFAEVDYALPVLGGAVTQW